MSSRLARLCVVVAVAAVAPCGCTFGYNAKFAARVLAPCAARVLHVPPPAGEYEEIGFVYATGGALATVDAVREELLEQACALGADAVYVPVPVYGMCTLEVLGYPSMHGVALRATRSSPPSLPPTPLDGAGLRDPEAPF